VLDGDLFGVRFLHEAVAVPQVERMAYFARLAAGDGKHV
jgi:hypothetical protein